MFTKEVASPYFIDAMIRIMVKKHISPSREVLDILLDVSDLLMAETSACRYASVLAWERSILHWIFFASVKPCPISRTDCSDAMYALVKEADTRNLTVPIWIGIKIVFIVLSQVVLHEKNGWAHVEQTLLFAEECFPLTAEHTGFTEGITCGQHLTTNSEKYDDDHAPRSEVEQLSESSMVITQDRIKAEILSALFGCLQGKVCSNDIPVAVASNIILLIMYAEEVLFPKQLIQDSSTPTLQGLDQITLFLSKILSLCTRICDLILHDGYFNVSYSSEISINV